MDYEPETTEYAVGCIFALLFAVFLVIQAIETFFGTRR